MQKAPKNKNTVPLITKGFQDSGKFYKLETKCDYKHAMLSFSQTSVSNLLRYILNLSAGRH